MRPKGVVFIFVINCVGMVGKEGLQGTLLMVIVRKPKQFSSFMVVISMVVHSVSKTGTKERSGHF